MVVQPAALSHTPTLSNFIWSFSERFKSIDSGAALSGFESHLCLLLAWGNYLTSLCLNFLIHKMGMKTEPASEGCCEDSIIILSQMALIAPDLRAFTVGKCLLLFFEGRKVTNGRIAKYRQNNQVGGGGGREWKVLEMSWIPSLQARASVDTGDARPVQARLSSPFGAMELKPEAIADVFLCGWDQGWQVVSHFSPLVLFTFTIHIYCFDTFKTNSHMSLNKLLGPLVCGSRPWDPTVHPWAMVEVLTSWESANAASQSFLLRELVYQHNTR